MAVNYLTFDDYVAAASSGLGMDPSTVRSMANQPLAESALAAPAAGFGDHEQYPDFPLKVAVLLKRVAGNHALPDGNKRAALLCAILFAGLNGFDWEPPQSDEPDGSETAEIVEAAAAGLIPLSALAAWIQLRLIDVTLEPDSEPEGEYSAVIHAAEYLGELPYEDHTIRIGDLEIPDVHGYNPAMVYLRRITGKGDGISVAEVMISVVGDHYAHEEIDVENFEAARYPLGEKEYWRGRMVGKYSIGARVMTDADFEREWAQGEG